MFYTKSDEYIWNEPKRPRAREQLKRLFKMVDASGRHYTTNPLHAPGETRKGDTGRMWA